MALQLLQEENLFTAWFIDFNSAKNSSKCLTLQTHREENQVRSLWSYPLTHHSSYNLCIARSDAGCLSWIWVGWYNGIFVRLFGKIWLNFYRNKRSLVHNVLGKFWFQFAFSIFFFLACYILDSYLFFNSKSSWSSTSGCHYPWIRVFLYRSDPSRWLYIYVYTLEGSHWGRVGCSQDLVPEYHYPLFTSANRAKLVPSPLLSRQAGWSAQLPIEQNVIAYLFLFRSISLSIYL